MKRIILSSIMLAALALGTNALAAAFTPGNLVIYRVGGDASGNTAATLTNRGNIVYLDEYTTNGASRIQSIMMPTNYFGANSPLISPGSTFGNGLITRSVDGRFILVTGYGATTNQFTFSLQTAFGTEAPRVIGLVDGNGNIDTSTTITNSAVNGEDPRSATSIDGTNLWFAGSAGGARYTLRGTGGVATNLAGGNLRQINIFNNQLFYDLFTNTNLLFTVTNNVPGIPTDSNGVVAVSVPGVTNINLFLTNPEAFLFFKLKAGGADPIDTLYVADSGTNNASGWIQKFSLVGSTWSNDGSIRSSGSVGLTGQLRIIGSVTNVDLWIVQDADATTGNNNLVHFTDSTGYHGVVSGNANAAILATSATEVNWHGIAFAPVGGETFPVGPATLSAGPLLDVFHTASSQCSVTTTDIYSIANLGASTMNWAASCPSNWVSFTPSSGSLGAGGSVTVAVTFNANVTSLPTGTNKTVITFTNNSGGIGTQTRNVQLTLKDQSITPTTDYTPAGQPGGPFSPLTATYTVFNGGASPITLIVTNSPAATWLGYNATNISLGTCASTNITVSVITNIANAFGNGNFTTVITFSNATAGTAIDTVNAQLSVGGLLFCDDFSTFTQNANLVPQQGWTAHGGTLNEPFVTNNAVYVGTLAGAGGSGSDEPFKNIPVLSNTFAYAAMVMTITSAPPVTVASPSRMVCFYSGQNEAGFASHYLGARDTGTGSFVFCIRGNSFTVYTFGTTPLTYNTSYRVILKAETSTSNTWVYVNPTSSSEGGNTPYASWHTTDPGSTPSVGCFSIQNAFGSSDPTPGVAIGKICIATNFTDAFNDIPAAPTDPFSTWQSQYFGGSGSPNAAGTADPDGDGMINTNEFMAGFDPTNGAAYVHIISTARSGNDIVVTYLGANGNATTTPASTSRTNVLEATTGTGNGSYATNGFAAIQTSVLSGGNGAGTVTSFTDVGGATGATKYYRIRVLVP